MAEIDSAMTELTRAMANLNIDDGPEQTATTSAVVHISDETGDTDDNFQQQAPTIEESYSEVPTNTPTVDEFPNLSELKKYYLSKEIKKSSHKLETIFEEPLIYNGQEYLMAILKMERVIKCLNKHCPPSPRKLTLRFLKARQLSTHYSFWPMKIVFDEILRNRMNRLYE